MCSLARASHEQSQQAARAAEAEKQKAISARTELENKTKAVEKTLNQQVRRRLQAEKAHRNMCKVSVAQQRRFKQIGVILDENGLTVAEHQKVQEY